jgi:two-component system sensor histidine kinase HydH
MKDRRTEIAFISGIILAITVAHYLTPPDLPLMHDLYRRLYYVPIVWSAIRFGLKGGLTASIAVSILFFPHVFHRWGTIVLQTTDAIFEIILYNAIAAVTGILASQERHHRDRLSQANLALIRSNQMKLLGEIAAGMAHEIRNPLASLRGGIELLGSDRQTADERSEVANILLPEVERVERAIKDFLLYAKPAEAHMEAVDAGEIAGEVRTLLAKGGYEGVKFNLEIEENLPSIRADRMQMRSVILNLALNAVAAVEGDGTVGIEAKRDGDFVLVSISDNGPGIDPEHADKIFEPFYTTREKGLGLGLSIVKRIVEEHGGTIGFESTPGEGTRFEVRFRKI